jgi:hypothetical protein
MRIFIKLGDPDAFYCSARCHVRTQAGEPYHGDVLAMQMVILFDS